MYKEVLALAWGRAEGGSTGLGSGGSAALALGDQQRAVLVHPPTGDEGR